MTKAERRRYTRHALHHRALIVTKGFNPVACDIGNVCEGGMLLLDVESPRLIEHLADRTDARVEVHLFCMDGGMEQHLRVLAEVRRASERQLGVEFVWPMPDLLRVLMQRQQDNGAKLLAVLPNDRRQAIWEDCQKRCAVFLRELMDQFHEEALDEVQQRQENAASFDEMNRLRDARILLIDTREPLERDFARYWQGLFQQVTGEGARRDSVRSLHVVEKTQFEEWLELQMIATAIASRQRRTLFLQHQYLSQVSGREVDERNNPLAPAALCQALQNALYRLSLPDYLKPLLFQAFEHALDQLWDSFVLSMNEYFTASGLRAVPMEKMRANWPEGPSRPSAHAEHAVARDRELQSEPVNDSTVEPREVSSASHQGSVLNLMRLLRTGGAPSASMQGTQSTDVTHATQTTETAPAEAGVNVAQELWEHKQAIRQALRDGNRSMHQVMDGLIAETPALQSQATDGLWDMADLVDQLFAPLAREPQLQPELLSLLRQLKLPVLQALLISPAFLDDPQHPGRRVLNYFVTLCAADRASSRNLEKTLAEVVEQILEVDGPDSAFLKGIGDRLEVLVERQERAFERNAERLAKTCEGQQRLEQARRAVHRRINALLAGNQIPVVLIELLSAGWEQLMVLALLKEGGDSTALAEMFSVLSQLNQWLGAEGNREDLAFERELETPVLLDEIERQLKSTGEPARYTPVLRQLRLLLQDEAEPEYVWLAAYPLGDSGEKRADEVSPSRWVDRARHLGVGDWVEHTLPDGETQQMKLVWVGEDAYKFVFLSSQGLHEVAMELSDLVDALSQGRIQQVDEGNVPFVDQSLYEVVQGIYRKMMFQATHDPLTGCMHRYEMEKQITRAVMQARLRGQVSALILFDIDQFSLVNSNYGTAAGDILLKQFAALLESWVESMTGEKSIGRVSSNEFALLLSPCEIEAALDCAERVRRQFQEQRFRHEGREFHATLSAGVAAIDGQTDDASVAINRVNLATSGAKKDGGNRVRPFRKDDQAQKHQQTQLDWVNRIDQALESGNLTLRAQRISRLDDQAEEHYELLLGLSGSELPFTTQDFVLAAEKYNRATALDRWVVERALAWMVGNPERLARIAMVSVNLSGHSLSDDQFMAYLEERLRKGGFPAEKLCFEVTETAAVANLHYTADFMREIKALGCRFALDDFGTGFSSYAYLQNLPVDFLKIDGTFVRDLADNLTHYALVRSINELAHFLNMETIAEFVDSDETADALREIRVDYAQGYGIEKPRLLSEL